MWLTAQAFPLFYCISRTESMLVSTSGERFVFVVWDCVAFALFLLQLFRIAARGHKLFLGLLEKAVFLVAVIARRLCLQIWDQRIRQSSRKPKTVIVIPQIAIVIPRNHQVLKNSNEIRKTHDFY